MRKTDISVNNNLDNSFSGTNVNSHYRSLSTFNFSRLFRLVFIFLLLVVVMRVALGSTQILTFSGFLNALHTAPSVDISWLRTFTNWGDSLTNIPLIGGGLAFLTKLVSVALFGATGAIQIALYAIWIFGYIF